jgi:hypothetical protein
MTAAWKDVQQQLVYERRDEFQVLLERLAAEAVPGRGPDRRHDG